MSNTETPRQLFWETLHGRLVPVEFIGRFWHPYIERELGVVKITRTTKFGSTYRKGDVITVAAHYLVNRARFDRKSIRKADLSQYEMRKLAV